MKNAKPVDFPVSSTFFKSVYYIGLNCFSSKHKFSGNSFAFLKFMLNLLKCNILNKAVILLATNFAVSLSSIIRELDLNEIFMPCDPDSVLVKSVEINRMGLELIGTLDDFDCNRILIMGQSEKIFLSTLTSNEIYKSIEMILCLRPPALLITRGIKPLTEILDIAKKYSIPIVISQEVTSDVISNLVAFLNTHLAPMITRSGGLMNVHGEGILMIGESGVGKSETAIELLNRGHKLIADDAVEIRRMSKNTLVGSAPDNIRHFIEVRGVGIINARRIFGIGAVKISENIDMVINLEAWKDNKTYDRMGSDTYTEILNVKIPFITIPVRTGRNLAVIIEIAAMNNRQKKMGYNAARELFINLGMEYPKVEPEMEKCIWDV